MPAAACHYGASGAKERAKILVLQTLGVKRVANWCQVSEGAVYQWLSRATDARPFPPDRVPAVMRGAGTDGVEFDATILWPELATVTAANAGASQ